MRYRIRYARVVIAAVCTGLAVLCVRGCLMARQAQPDVAAPDAARTETAAPAQAQAPSIPVLLCSGGQTAQLSLEEYLVGVVAAEMPASFDPEALKAQAVAARTYTVYKGAHGGCRSTDGDVCTSSACCQAYASDAALRGRWGDTYSDNLAKIRSAVESTAGEVLLYGGEPIEALYHSASGGRTEDSEAVYAIAVPYLRSVESTNESGSSHLTGSVTLSRKSFAQRINGAWSDAHVSANSLEEQIVILQKSQAGRVMLLRAGDVEITGKQLRALFGLDSTLFTFTFTRSSVRMDTRGFGHGVGMSQTGANSMGKGGQTYREILLYYYSGAELGKIES